VKFILWNALFLALLGCDGRSIDSATYDRMKNDMSWLQHSCADASQPVVIHKGQWARISINCAQPNGFGRWRDLITELVASQGWVKIVDEESSREFCNSLTGVHMRLSQEIISSNNDGSRNYLSMRYPAAGAACAKYRPDIYRPLETSATTATSTKPRSKVE
jgi:hypothetical protein